MRKQALMFASCSLWVLFLLASACLAQSVVALDKPSQQEERMKGCLESTCRNVPNREKLTAINLSKRYIRGIFGGFEQGAGIAGGVQLNAHVFTYGSASIALSAHASLQVILGVTVAGFAVRRYLPR